MKRSDIGRALRRGNALPKLNTLKSHHTLRILGGATVTLLFLWLLHLRLATVDLAEVTAAFSDVPSISWVLALLATGVSFWAVGQYDASLHRHLNTGLLPKQTHRAGMAAIALGQTLGLGLLTGALVRWRMLPDLSLAKATKLSAAVTLSFLFGWSMVTAVILLILPDASLKPAASLVCGVGLGVTVLCLIQPRLRLFGRNLALPNLITLSHVLAFCFVDTAAAAVALWLLCPPDLMLPFATLLPAYLLALGAGLLSGTPGGVGAFEVTLLTALPSVPEPGLMAGVLAFRLAYYALPAVLAASVAIKTPLAARSEPIPARTAPYPNAPAEAGLTAQNQLRVVQILPNTQALIGETPHSLTMLLTPFGQRSGRHILHALQRRAAEQARIPCLYKCNARLAATARAAGWTVSPIAAEAWLNPVSFTLDGPEKSALRRKLRKAEMGGVTIRELTQTDWPDLPPINQDWARNNGGERGFSMGRFAPTDVAAQHVFGAFAGGRLCAFVSFHHTQHEWALDLMRHDENTPDGTAYALVTHALQAAPATGITRFSLAAAPRLPELGALLRCGFAAPKGLCQFKSAFAPVWQPLYIAAPSHSSLILVAAEIYREIHAPPPLSCGPPQDHPVQNKIASHGQPWQTRGK